MFMQLCTPPKRPGPACQRGARVNRDREMVAAWVERSAGSEHTRAQYMRWWRRFEKWLKGRSDRTTCVPDVDVAMLTRWAADACVFDRKRRMWVTPPANDIRAARSFWAFCHAAGYVRANVAKLALRQPKMQRVKKPERRAIGNKAISALLEGDFENAVDRFAIFLLYTCGLRFSECKWARWGHLHQRSGNWIWHLPKRKGGDSLDVPVPQLIADLHAEAKAEVEYYLARPVDDEELVFADPAKPWQPHWRFRQRIEQYLTAERLGHRIVPHGLRATHGSVGYRKAGLVAAQRSMGHCKVETTQGYVDIDPSEYASMVVLPERLMTETRAQREQSFGRGVPHAREIFATGEAPRLTRATLRVIEGQQHEPGSKPPKQAELRLLRRQLNQLE